MARIYFFTTPLTFDLRFGHEFWDEIKLDQMYVWGSLCSATVHEAYPLTAQRGRSHETIDLHMINLSHTHATPQNKDGLHLSRNGKLTSKSFESIRMHTFSVNSK